MGFQNESGRRYPWTMIQKERRRRVRVQKQKKRKRMDEKLVAQCQFFFPAIFQREKKRTATGDREEEKSTKVIEEEEQSRARSNKKKKKREWWKRIGLGCTEEQRRLLLGRTEGKLWKRRKERKSGKNELLLFKAMQEKLMTSNTVPGRIMAAATPWGSSHGRRRYWLDGLQNRAITLLQASNAHRRYNIAASRPAWLWVRAVGWCL